MDLLPDLERQQERERYQTLQNELIEVMRRHNPLAFDPEKRRVEYVPEVETMLPRVRDAGSEEEVREIVVEEVARWRGADLVGDEESYAPIARDIAQAVRRFRERDRR